MDYSYTALYLTDEPPIKYNFMRTLVKDGQYWIYDTPLWFWAE